MKRVIKGGRKTDPVHCWKLKFRGSWKSEKEGWVPPPTRDEDWVPRVCSGPHLPRPGEAVPQNTRDVRACVTGCSPWSRVANSDVEQGGASQGARKNLCLECRGVRGYLHPRPPKHNNLKRTVTIHRSAQTAVFSNLLTKVTKVRPPVSH